jgi:hypothetical protein
LNEIERLNQNVSDNEKQMMEMDEDHQDEISRLQEEMRMLKAKMEDEYSREVERL